VPESLVVSDQELRRRVGVGPGVDLAGEEDLADHRGAVGGIAQGFQLRLQLVAQRIELLAVRNDSVAFAADAVHEEPGEAEREGLRPRPVDLLEPVAGGLGAVLQEQVAVLEQPRVQVHAAAEAREAVVGDHHEHRVRLAFDLRADLADERVHPLVGVGDHALVGLELLVPVRRVVGLGARRTCG
jgi:hypothetical protein